METEDHDNGLSGKSDLLIHIFFVKLRYQQYHLKPDTDPDVVSLTPGQLADADGANRQRTERGGVERYSACKCVLVQSWTLLKCIVH